MFRKIKTWHVENATVALFLLLIWYFSGHKYIEIIGSIAVFCGFCCTSISERLREIEAAKSSPSVKCYKLYNVYFLIKEICWFTYFIALHSWSALGGCLIFGIYPFWRKYWRKIHPIGNRQLNEK